MVKKFKDYLKEETTYRGYVLTTYYNQDPPLGGRHYRTFFKVPGAKVAEEGPIHSSKDQAIVGLKKHIDMLIAYGKLKDFTWLR
jgi:hypothetical protein